MAAWDWLGGRGGFRLVQVVMLVTVLVVGYLVYAQQRTVDCTRAYNEAQARASAARAEAAAADAAALDQLIRDLREGKPFQQRADEYLATRDASIKQRHDNPIIPPPSDYCG